jgi:hypothetical protein
MPLYADAPTLLRANLQSLACGKRVRLVAIGKLTDTQLNAINQERLARGYPPIEAEVVFLGQHIFNSRLKRDGYSIDDVIEQIASAMDAESVARETFRGTTLQSLGRREDRYGNRVRDLAVLECSARHPRPELFSVIPKGDVNKPKKKAAHSS